NRNENKAESFVGKFGAPDDRWQLFEVPFSVAQLLAEEIDGNHRGYEDRGYHRPAANLFAGTSEIVKCHIPQRDRDVACYADCVDYCHYVELTFHLAHT